MESHITNQKINQSSLFENLDIKDEQFIKYKTGFDLDANSNQLDESLLAFWSDLELMVSLYSQAGNALCGRDHQRAHLLFMRANAIRDRYFDRSKTFGSFEFRFGLPALNEKGS